MSQGDEIVFTNPSLFPGIDAEEVVEALLDLNEKFGGALTKLDIIHAASDPRSPLHKCLEWDNRKAAERWRKTQITSLMTGLVKRDRRGRERRVFVYVQPDEDSRRKAYVPMDSALRQPSMNRQFVQQGWRELARWRKKYGGYAGLRDVASMIREKAQESPEAKTA